MATGLLVFSTVTFLILVNALYVAAEFGAVSARRSRIQELADGGNWLAGLLLPVVQSPAALDRYVATSQIGITLSSLVLGAYAQSTIAVWLTPFLAGALAAFFTPFLATFFGARLVAFFGAPLATFFVDLAGAAVEPTVAVAGRAAVVTVGTDLWVTLRVAAGWARLNQ